MLSPLAKLERLFELGMITITTGLAWPEYSHFIEPANGQAVSDLWTFQPYTREKNLVYGTDDGIDEDVRWLNPKDAERLRYPTQKPLGLLQRIIEASSSDGDVILDPFCGCGTTIQAAQTYNRRWIGIDITHLAINLIKVRLADAFGPTITASYKVIGEPTDLTGAQALADQDKYQFQYRALGLVNARPIEQKKGADKGIDGRLYITDANETADIIISVKGGHVTASQVRDLRGVIEREGAAIGVFITLEPATAPMRKEAAEAGHWQTKAVTGTSHPRLQILTVEDLLAGRKIDMPHVQAVRSFKQAPKAKSKKKADAELF